MNATTGSATTGATENSTKLLQLAQQNVASVKETEYTSTVQIDPAQGIFKAECSSYVQYVVNAISSAAIAEVPVSAKSNRPVAKGFAEFFHGLYDGSKTSSTWDAVKTLDDLKPGDIVAWVSPESTTTDSDENTGQNEDKHGTGHVMIVGEQPYKSSKYEALDFRVIDCTHVHHANDSRAEGKTGLGMGNVGLHRSSTVFAEGYYWKADEGTMKKTTIAAARLK